MTMNMDGIVLAAGLSSRTGAYKLELDLAGKPLICHTIERLLDFCSQIIVVGGHKMDRVQELVQDYPNVRLVFNPNFASGMFGSVKIGVQETTSEWFFLTPGDHPLIAPSSMQALLDAATHEPHQSIFIPVHKGWKGHPILMNQRIKNALVNETEDSNLRHFTTTQGFVPVQVADEGILVDIDTMDDYYKVQQRMEKEPLN